MGMLTEGQLLSPSHRFKHLLLCSLALHAALLAWVTMPRKQADPERLITLSLNLISTPAAETARNATTESSETSTAKAVPRLKPHSRSTAQTPATVSATTPVTATPEARQSPPPTAPLTPTVAGGAVRPATETTAPTPPSPAIDQQTLLNRYAQQLSRTLARQQGYPRLAALRGWEGEVRLRLHIARKGNLLAIDVDRSSGYDILDQHALQLVDASGPLPALPDELGSNEIQITVPVSYKLRKTT